MLAKLLKAISMAEWHSNPFQVAVFTPPCNSMVMPLNNPACGWPSSKIKCLKQAICKFGVFHWNLLLLELVIQGIHQFGLVAYIDLHLEILRDIFCHVCKVGCFHVHYITCLTHKLSSSFINDTDDNYKNSACERFLVVIKYCSILTIA